MHPKTFFKAFFKQDPPLPNAGYCFVAMPFAKDFNAVYTAIKDVLESEELGFRCYRADKEARSGFVMEDVLRELKDAEVVIADLTECNANVFYELGVAHTVKDKESVVLISQDKVPFDVRSYRYWKYKPDSLQLLKKRLVSAVKEITPARKHITKLRGESYESEALVLGSDSKIFYRFSIRVVKVAEGAAKLRLEVWPDEHPNQRRGKNHVLRLWEMVVIPKINYAVKLHAVSSDEAEFCICAPPPPPT